MFLDMEPNLTAEYEWNQLRRSRGADAVGLTPILGLAVVREVFFRAYTKHIITQGGRKVGCVVGQPLNRDAVLVDRAASLFRSLVKKKDVTFEDTASGLILETPEGPMLDLQGCFLFPCANN